VKEKLTKKSLTAEKLLKRDNKSVLNYVEDIKNVNEKERTINELIDYLDNCLLNRDIGKPGPKLIDQLKKLLQKKENEVKEYRLEDLIWWKGSEPMLVYLFDLLNASGLIDQTQYDNRFALMAKHFKNKNAKNFDNKQLARVYDRMREDGLFRKPKVSSAQAIEIIINEIRDKLNELED